MPRLVRIVKKVKNYILKGKKYVKDFKPGNYTQPNSQVPFHPPLSKHT